MYTHDIATPVNDAVSGNEFSTLPLEIQVGPVLGQGTSGIVSSVHAAIDKGHYVVKEVPITGGADAAVLEEVRLHRLCSAQCSDVVRYIFAFQAVGKLLVLMERCDAVLWDVLAGEPAWESVYGAAQPLSLHDCKAWTGGLCRAVQHCHSLRVLHRDINPWNIFIACEQRPAATGGVRFTAKLGDFGLGVLLDGSEELIGLEAPGAACLDDSALGSLYSAPELGHRYGFPADIFSLGMTLLALWSRADGCKVDAVIEVVEGAKAQAPEPDALHTLWLQSAPLARAVVRMISAKPAARGAMVDLQRKIERGAEGSCSVALADAAVQATVSTRTHATDASASAPAVESLPGHVLCPSANKHYSARDVGLSPQDFVSKPARKGTWMTRFARCLTPSRGKSSRVKPFAT